MDDRDPAGSSTFLQGALSDSKTRRSNPIAAKLRAYDILTDHEAEVLENAMGVRRHYGVGSDLVRIHDCPNHSTAILDGWAARYAVLRDGRRQITAIHVPGDFVDLNSFLIRPMDHGIMALSPCELAEVPHDNLRKLSETEPHLTRLLWTATLVDGAILRQWLVATGALAALARTAHLICELYVRLEAVGRASKLTFSCPLTQAELGEALGISTVHVNRSIQDLRSRELLQWRQGVITITDWTRLVHLGQFDAVYLQHQQTPR